MDGAIIVSRVLKESRFISSLMGMATDETFPRLVKETEALEQYPGSNELSESGRALANNASRLMFEDLATRHPKRAETMASAIETLGTMMPDSIIIDNYDWASFGTATMVNVGGGKGLYADNSRKTSPSSHSLYRISKRLPPQGIVTNKFHEREPNNEHGQTLALVEAMWEG